MLSDKYITKFVRVEPFGSRKRGSRSIKMSYYPRCKKPIELNVDNLPFSNTIGKILAKMEPRHDNYFRFGLGYGPYLPGIDAQTDTQAFEVMIRFKTLVKIHMTMLFGDVSDYTN